MTPSPTRAIALGAVIAALVPAAPALAGSERFIPSAVEHPDATVTLPLHRGTSHGVTVWYVILDASDGAAADRYGANTAQKLRNARGTGAVQRVRMVDG